LDKPPTSPHCREDGGNIRHPTRDALGPRGDSPRQQVGCEVPGDVIAPIRTARIPSSPRGEIINNVDALHMKFIHLFVLAAVFAATPSGARAATFDLATATIADIDAAIDAGALSSEQLVGLYLKRIEAYDKKGPRVNAVIMLNPKALQEARALDVERKAKGRRSPLHGIPVVVKDLIDVAGLPTTAGYKPFGAPIAPRDAEIVRRMRQAGAVILAKVNTVNWFGNDYDETHVIGATLNPYNLEYSPGGSSNGTGAALAANFATIGIGTDTGGSVQNPSAYCSLAGMVATQGLVSRAGIVPRGATQDRAGPMGRSVYDITVLLSHISGWDAEDLITSRAMGHFPKEDWSRYLTAADLKGRRIGVLREMIYTRPVDAEGLGIFERSLDDMRKAGAQIVDPVLTGLDLKALTTSAAGRTAEYEKLFVQNAYLERLGPNRPYRTMQEMIEKVGPGKFQKAMLDALTLDPPDKSADYEARMRNVTMIRELIEELVDRYKLDALVFARNTVPPPRFENMAVQPPYPIGGSNSLSSNSGLPSVIMPAGYTQKEGLPIAVQFVSKPFDDLRLLQVAYGFEQSNKRRRAPATTPPLRGERFDY
jgi:Asp-tRNA(Asn)/Glu-tRNA(Gln) amidotransferase A subunit family amidase